MDIVPLQKTDIKTALELIWDVFVEFESPDYSEQGIATFKNFIHYKSIIEKVDSGELFFWGCFIDENFVGVLASKDISHISMLFVKKEYHRRGVAKKLFKTLIDLCKTSGGVKKITVNSSPYAIEAYHRLGFRDTDTKQTVDGLTFIPMEYILEPVQAPLDCSVTLS